MLDREPGWPFWVHFDVDVLDRAVMPAVDTPGRPGIDPEDVITILLRSLASAPACCGMTVTIFDPDLDPAGNLAVMLVQMIKRVFDGRSGVARRR